MPNTCIINKQSNWKSFQKINMMMINFHHQICYLQSILPFCSLQSYAARKKDLSDIDESVAADLTEVEKYLLTSQELMTVRGKVLFFAFL